MSKPMPLTVYGIVTPISQFVRVTGVLHRAEIYILDNGQEIGHALADNPGELLVKLTTQPTLGHSITAIQKTSEGTSKPSAQSIPVVKVPDPLPVPVILSSLNACISDILADGLVPGAQVITSIGGQPFGSSIASQSKSWLGIDPTQQIIPGSRATVHQEAHIGATTLVSKGVETPNIPDILSPMRYGHNLQLLPPPVIGSLVECDTSREFLQAIPGAGTTITNNVDQSWEFWLNPLAAFHGYGAPPVKKGTTATVIATQAMPRCKLTGESVTLPVAPAAAPPAPTVTQNFCPQTLRLSVSNLAPGGVLFIQREVIDDKTGTIYSQEDVGDHGIQYETEQVDLPPDIALSDPAGSVVLHLSQRRCGPESPFTRVKIAPLWGGPFGPPKIVEPLFVCSRGIPITGAHPDAIVQAIDASSNIPISDPISVTQADFILHPWLPLALGKVLVRQYGCKADGDSQVAQVKPLPQQLPMLKIFEPVRPKAPWLKVTGVVAGARLYLFVMKQQENGLIELRPGSVDIYADTGIIPVTGPDLADGDRVYVIQKLCDAESNLQDGVIVKCSNMKVSVAPPQVPRGKTVQVVVTAVDADIGSPISADVLLKGQLVGTTGVPFAYSPKLGDPNPVGIVRNSIACFDAKFTINLVDPTLGDPTWTLTLHANPIPANLENIKIDITQITWKVTPDWNVALAKTVKVTPTPPAAIGSVALPVPPTGAVKTVTVEISVNASTQGGYLNGYTIPAQSFSIRTDTEKVGFHGPNETIAWLLKPTYVADPTTGEIIIWIVPTFFGITP